MLFSAEELLNVAHQCTLLQSNHTYSVYARRLHWNHFTARQEDPLLGHHALNGSQLYNTQRSTPFHLASFSARARNAQSAEWERHDGTGVFR